MQHVDMKSENLYNIVWMSRPMMQAAEMTVEQGLTGTGLTVRMRAVLEILNAHGDLTVPDIAARLEIQRQYVQVMVNETLASGFTEQRPNPRHKRSPLLALTPNGRALIERVVAQEIHMMAEISEDFDEAEVATALRVVRAATAKRKERLAEPGK